jgi:hypothetical protein
MIKSLKYKVYAKVDPIYSIHNRVLRLHRPKFKRVRSLVKRNFLFSKDVYTTFYPNFQNYRISNPRHHIHYESFFKNWLSTTALDRTKRNMIAKLLKPQMFFDSDNKNKFNSWPKNDDFKNSKNHKTNDSFKPKFNLKEQNNSDSFKKENFFKKKKR